MTRQLGIGILTGSAIVTLAACSGGGGSPGGGGGTTPTPPPVVTESYTFPSGDATAASGTAWDITGVKTTLSGVYGQPSSYDTLRVDVTFAQDISNALPAPGAMLTDPTQLGVQIFLDVDGNPNTGTNPACTTATPFEYLSEGGTAPSRLADGNYAILGAGGAPTFVGSGQPSAEAVTTITGRVLSQSFYLPTISVFDGKNVPRVGVAVQAFNGAEETTDCVPKAALEFFTTS